MDKNTRPTQFQKDELWPSIISLFIPLIQLIAVVTMGLSNIFKISIFFFFPEILNLINLLLLFVAFSAIGFYWYWRSNLYILNIPEVVSVEQKPKYVPEQKRIAKIIKFLLIVSVISLAIFVFTVANIFSDVTILPVLWLGVIQYLSYGGIIITSGLIIYIWIYEYIKKKQTFKREDFVKNLVNTLSDYGIVNPPDIKIWKNQIARSALSKVVEIEVNSKRLIVVCSFDGVDISEIYEKEEYERLLRGTT